MDPVFELLKTKGAIFEPFKGIAADMQLLKEGAYLRQTYNGLACDAQPQLTTVSNAGIPAFLSTYIDPKMIEVLFSPMKATEVAGSEVKKGDWTTQTAMFPMIEATGETSSYGDYNTNGSNKVNANYPQRQAYTYQTMSEWGERELETAGLGRIDLANRINMASILTLNKFQNKTYLFGVAGLENYGLLNDPALSAPIAPTTKMAGGTTWAVATGTEVLADITKLYVKLQNQANGVVDRSTAMTLVMSPISDGNGMTKVTDFNVSVAEKIAKIYPNMKVVTCPEYSTDAGEVVQLKADNVEGQETVVTAFTEKLRAHPIIIAASSFSQKKSQGSWGAIYFRPALVAQMIGV